MSGTFKLWRLTMKTDSGGDAVAVAPLVGRLVAVDVDLGDLSTPDIDVTDEPAGTSLLSVNGVAADTRYHLATKMQDSTGGDADSDGGDVFTAPTVLGQVKVVIAGGGANKTGTVRLLCER